MKCWRTDDGRRTADDRRRTKSDDNSSHGLKARWAKKEASLSKLPPCEATFHQHVLRASLQTYIWKSSQKTQSLVRSPLMFRWDFCFICQNKTFKKDFKVHTSTRDGRRFIPIHEIVNSLNPVFCQILSAAHALSGCDTTSSMFGIWKRTVYKVLRASQRSSVI